MTSRLTTTTTTSVALCVAAAALLAACGGSSTPTASAGVSPSVAASSAAPQGVPSATPPTGTPGAATAVDPCSLLTAAEVSAATGGTVAEGKAENATGPLGGKKCNWSSDGAPVIDFEVTVQTNADITVPGQTIDSLFDETTNTFPGLTAVAGIGTKAFFGKTQGYVLAGSYLVTTVADIGGTADSSSINKALTAMAVAKL